MPETPRELKNKILEVSDTGHEVPMNRCPVCDTELNRASPVGYDMSPQPGDCTICIACGNLMAFTEALTLRPLTDAEHKLIAQTAGYRELIETTQRAVMEVAKAHRH